MAMDGTYSGLKASVADWLNRADLTSQIPDFVVLAEAKFNRKLRVLQMQILATLTATDGTLDVPADWLATRNLKLASAPRGGPSLEYVGEEELSELTADLLNGPTRYYTIVNGAFLLIPAPTVSTDFSLSYYAKIPALSGAAPSNWLLLKSPDLYLYGSLLEAEAYLKDDARLPVWSAAWQGTIDDMKIESEGAMRNATQMNVRRKSFG